MIISEQEKQRILSMHKNYGYRTINESPEIITEQLKNNYKELFKSIESNFEKWIDREGEIALEKYLVKDSRPFKERFVEWIRNIIKKITLTKSESEMLAELVSTQVKTSVNFRNNFVLKKFPKWKEVYKTHPNKLEKFVKYNFGEESWNLFLNLNKSPLKLNDIISNRVIMTIKDTKVKNELENFLKLTLTERNYHFEWNPKTKKQESYFVSEDGTLTPTTYLDWYIKGHVSGHDVGLNDNLSKLPTKLSNGTEFRLKIKTIIEKDIPEFDLSKVPPMDLRENWRIDTIPNESPNDLMNRQYQLINELVNKCDRYKGETFDQTKIKIIGKQYITGRNVFEIELPKGEKILCYESSGSNTETTGKKNGEWFVIPGFGKLYKDGVLISDTWFIKTPENVGITSNNQYFKDLDMYLRAIHGYQ